MRTLIVDDERLARSELKRLLAPHSDIRVVGEAANVVEARAKVEQLAPALLLLDIEMPGGTGFDLLESLEWAPHVIFTTAYSQHAVRAFEVNAIDYLLKPIDPARLTSALDRIERPKPKDAVRASTPGRLFVRDGERCWFIDSGDIPLIVSDGNHARLCVAGHEPMIPRTLNRLEEQLASLNFFRANRAQLVNLDWVDRRVAWSSSSGTDDRWSFRGGSHGSFANVARFRCETAHRRKLGNPWRCVSLGMLLE